MWLFLGGYSGSGRADMEARARLPSASAVFEVAASMSSKSRSRRGGAGTADRKMASPAPVPQPWTPPVRARRSQHVRIVSFLPEPPVLVKKKKRRKGEKDFNPRQWRDTRRLSSHGRAEAVPLADGNPLISWSARTCSKHTHTRTTHVFPFSFFSLPARLRQSVGGVAAGSGTYRHSSEDCGACSMCPSRCAATARSGDGASGEDTQRIRRAFARRDSATT